MVCWIEGGADFFLLVFCLAAPSSYRVDRGRHLASSTFAGVSQCRALSPDFPAGARGLYPLARGRRDLTGARDGPALMVCWIEGGADFFLLVFCLAAPSSYRVDRGRHLASSTFAGVSQCRALSPVFSGWRSRSLSLGEGPTGFDRRAGWTRADGVLDRGRRRLFSFSVLPGGAVELPGRSRPAPGVVDLRWGISMSSSLSRFSGWRSRSLSLGEGPTESDGRAGWTRADGVLDRGRRRLFSF